MEYFLLKVSNHVNKPIKPKLQSVSTLITEVSDLADYSIGYYDREGNEKTDILTVPLFMVSEEIKNVLKMYDADMICKGIQLFSNDEEYVPILYFAIQPYRADCLHRDVRINPNGTVNEVVLDKKMIPNKDIFVIDRLIETKIVISLRVAESLLRRSIYGIGLETIKVR